MLTAVLSAQKRCSYNFHTGLDKICTTSSVEAIEHDREGLLGDRLVIQRLGPLVRALVNPQCFNSISDATV